MREGPWGLEGCLGCSAVAMGPALLSMGCPGTASSLPVPSEVRATAMWGERWGRQILLWVTLCAVWAGELVCKAQGTHGRVGDLESRIVW